MILTEKRRLVPESALYYTVCLLDKVFLECKTQLQHILIMEDLCITCCYSAETRREIELCAELRQSLLYVRVSQYDCHRPPPEKGSSHSRILR